jgi:8-hydroxy-5-deazaflavin:NADPH oxidoreductase
MSTAVIGIGTLGSAIARRLGSRGERLRLSSPEQESADALAAAIGPGAVVASSNRNALRGAESVILAVRWAALRSVIDEIADCLEEILVVVPSNPVGLDDNGDVIRLLAPGMVSGPVVAGWLPAGSRLAMAFGSMSAPLFESVAGRSPQLAALFYGADDPDAAGRIERLIRVAGFGPVKVGGVDQSSRLEVGGDLHDLVVGIDEARSLVSSPQPVQTR